MWRSPNGAAARAPPESRPCPCRRAHAPAEPCTRSTARSSHSGREPAAPWQKCSNAYVFRPKSCGLWAVEDREVAVEGKRLPAKLSGGAAEPRLERGVYRTLNVTQQRGLAALLVSCGRRSTPSNHAEPGQSAQHFARKLPGHCPFDGLLLLRRQRDRRSAL